ncbi:MAG: enoyl-CoA hydratase/isomerase family protein [Pseudomonadales bacterium]|nr:enoyl-CoA hydratase/isomerase family protein [Pseudomonadales bacterium]
MNDTPITTERLNTASSMQVGIATLSSPRSLNALSLDMVRLLDQQLRQWQADPQIALVVLKGEGERAFCAGGDIRRLYDSIRALPAGARNPEAEYFFSEEYRLDYLLHTYTKPVLIWATGVVMGGGMGLLAGASHRIVTETSRLAMPEIGIGLFPDVGGSWFLNRLPPGMGCFLGMTGAPLNAADALYAGLADYYLGNSQFATLMESLVASEFDIDAAYNHRMLSHIMRELGRQSPELPESPLRQHEDLIRHAGRGDSAVEVISNILALDSTSPWIQQAISTLKTGSPITASLVFEQLRRGRHRSLAECFNMEFIMAVRCCQFGDLAEGVRARLVDKDQQPHWQHQHAGMIDMDTYFLWPAHWGQQPVVIPPEKN